MYIVHIYDIRFALLRYFYPFLFFILSFTFLLCVCGLFKRTLKDTIMYVVLGNCPSYGSTLLNIVSVNSSSYAASVGSTYASTLRLTRRCYWERQHMQVTWVWPGGPLGWLSGPWLTSNRKLWADGGRLADGSSCPVADIWQGPVHQSVRR